MYTFEELMCPVWDTDTIYDESLTMVEKDGIAEASLLYTPSENLSVTSADKLHVYEEGRDYQIQGNTLSLTPDSRIFRFTEADLCFETPLPGQCFPTRDGRYSLFGEGHFFHDRQIAVTYRKKEGDFSYIPPFAGALLPKTMEKLQKKEPLKLVLYGDSISEGYNSSGFTLTTPFLPPYGALAAEKLRRHYDTSVQFVNPSLGGMATDWGMANARNLVGDQKPDLAIIAFGMNDNLTGADFAKNIQIIRERILEISPHTEFILCATTMPNMILSAFYHHQDEYEEALTSMEGMGTAIASFYRLQKALFEKKRFIDDTRNNVNHPNDFMVRCHAQLIVQMLTAPEK